MFYKVINNNFTSIYRNFLFEVGKTYIINGQLKVCKNGFHFSKNFTDCLKYVNFLKDIEKFKFLEIEHCGDNIIGNITRLCSNNIKVIREVPTTEVLKEFWLKDGKLHREDGPTIKWSDGSKLWYLNGKKHRENGPAVEWPGGNKLWYINGKLHREDGPAVELSDGTKEWYLNGLRHREDGPAVVYSNGYKYWYINGICIK